MPSPRTITVIGGGPAGMMAAVAAARAGARVVLWEKNGSLGRKLLATGNGRCNLSNRDLDPRHFHGGGRDHVAHALSAFGPGPTLELFGRLGLEHYHDDRGRCFPASNEAGSVLFALEHELARLGVEIGTRREIVAVDRGRPGFVVRQRGRDQRCDAVVLACGGAASPQFGANGGGFELARRLGHRVTPIGPSLVPLDLAGNWFHKLQGVRLDMTLTLNGSAPITDEGLFTHYGLSGPLALRASRAVAAGPTSGTLSFTPGLGRGTVRDRLRLRREQLAGRMSAEFLCGWLPEKAGRMLVRESGIAAEATVSAIDDALLDVLAGNIVAFPAAINALRGLKEAQVTAGGVDCGEIFPGTMGSTLVPGLFFCGEVVDVDGDSGGYNLQWCWSSAWVAGTAAAG
ncbi:MAG: aminoacetone oxidase family FAD-binding enzyme [Candidatus Edwardsbacteria bacterium]|jgi:hypothetical protein|nr:aminoacetone oxidase family FAD-binding enzyme [Candidatus Edwardsbacteria bacterium]